MERLCPKFFFLFGWLLFLPQLVSAFTISVYKDGYNVKTDFSVVEGSSNHEMVATVKITNYTGASDYQFWISDSENFNNAQSKNFNLGSSNASQGDVSGSEYLSSTSTCSRGTIELTVYIDSNSSAPNWYPHGVECKQIDDNISNLVVSVYKDGFNAKSTFTKVDDTSDEMVATVYIEDYTGAGDYEFWVGFGGWSNGVSEKVNLGDYLSSECEAENIEVTFKVNRNSTAANLNPHDVTCKENHGIYIYSSTFYVDSKIDEFVLQSFIEDNSIKVRNYKWEYQREGESTWIPVDNTPTSQITVNRNQFLDKTSRFRLTVTTDTDETFESDNTWLMGFAPICTGDTKTVTVFEQDFGTVPADYNGYNGDGKRFKYRADPQGNSGYTYAPYPRKINDGGYALVADPYWCGCGDGTNQPEESVENCTDKNRTTNEGDGGNWYRGYVYPTQSGIKFRDHTKNEQSDLATEYGLALMINYAENDDTLAYEHVLTDEEMVKMVPGSTVRFSAHIASIAKYWSEQESVDKGVTMTISIDYNPVSNDPDDANWETWVSEPQKVKHHDNWYPIVTDEMELPDRAGYYRIRIYSDGNSGRGYDILIDDIRLEACQPVINAHFEYEEGGTTVTGTEVVMKDLSDTYTVVVPKFDEGMLGDNPEVMLFTYDETTGSYKYIGKMTYNETSKNYTFVVSKDYFDDIPDTVTFVAVATSKDKADTLAERIEYKLVDPTNSLECFRSEELLTMSIDCLADPTIEIAEGSVVNICGELDSDGKPIFDYPSVRIRFANITDAVFYSITSKYTIPSGSSATGAVEYTSDFVQINSADLANGYVDVDLETFKDGLKWIPGVRYTVTVNVKEQYKGKDVCLRSSAEGVSFNIHYMPSFSADLEDAPEMCRGQVVDKQINAPGILYADTYLWQVSKDDGITWDDAEGVNTKEKYIFPADAEDGWQYKLLISRVTDDFTCGPVESNPITLTVNDCEDYQLAQTIVGDHAYCVGDKISLTWTIKNLNSVADQVNVQVSSEALPDGVEFLSDDADAGISYDETTKQILWNIGTMQPEEQLTVSLKLRYSSYVTASVNKMLRIWISSSNSDTFATFEDQTNAGWYDRDQITLKGQTPKPTTSLEGQNYVSCAESGILDLETLLSGNYSDGVLSWYTDDALTQVLDPAEIDKSAVCDHDTYYVTFTDTEHNLCASDTLQIHVTIKGISALPVTTSDVVDGTYEICAAESGTLSLSTLVEAPYEILTWYTDAALTQEFVPAEIDMTVAQDVTYYVTNTETGKCPSAAVAVRILIKANTEAPTVIVDAEGYAYSECAAAGSKSLSELIVSHDGTLQWYDAAGNPLGTGASFDTSEAGETTYYASSISADGCESAKAEVKVRVLAAGVAPDVLDYNECAQEGSKSLSELIVSHDGTLQWYDAAGNPLGTGASFDTSEAGETTYYASSISADGCESAKAEVKVRVVANSSALTTTSAVSEDGTFATCQATGSSILAWSDLIAAPHGVLNWYSDEDLQNPVPEPQVDLSVAQDVTYYVTNTEDGLCESLPVLLHIVVNAVPSAPVAAEDPDNAGYAYSECASAGSKSLSELIVSHDGTLQWYDAAGNPLGTGASFDTSEAGETTYYASSISADGCESAKAEVKVRVLAAGVAPDVLDYNECAQEGTYNLDNLATTPQGTLEWFGDASATQLLSPATFDMAQVGNHTYYVRATASGECHSEVVPVSVVIRDVATASDISVDDLDVCPGAEASLTASTSMDDENMVFTWYSDAELGNSIGTGATLQITGPDAQATYYVTVKGDNTCENLPGDAAEAAVYAIAPIDNIRLEPVEERIGMGKETEKALTVEPTDAYYTAVWTANGQVIADPDSYFPAKPYDDVEYKVVVTDECGNEMEASAITKVVWPTIITPQNADGKNDDFLVGMQEDIHLEIFDRWGNVVFSGNDGWSQAEAAKQQPGVYYYIATLPDGTAKQGTIEVYK